MSINFFEASCKTESNTNEFGLCDDPPPAENPAYINEDDFSKWIAIVDNPDNKDVDFYAIDHCVEILREDGTKENRCDGILHYDNNLTFVELKDRTGSGWLGKGRKQLTTTIEAFSKTHDINNYTKVEAYISNNLRPRSNSNYIIDIQKFKDATGLILNIEQKISI